MASGLPLVNIVSADVIVLYIATDEIAGVDTVKAIRVP
jgi:hypothetical protein